MSKRAVWDQFVYKSDKACCNYCNTLVNRKPRRLVKHLHECSKCPANVASLYDNDGNLIQNSDSQGEDSNQNNQSNTNDDNYDSNSKRNHFGPVRKKRKLSETSINTLLNYSIPTLSKTDTKEVDHLLAMAVFTGRLPFNFFENQYFRRALNILRPTYQVPSAKRLRNSLLNEAEKKIDKETDDVCCLVCFILFHILS